MKHSNLFPAFTSFLDSPHLLSGNELIVSADPTGLMQGLRLDISRLEREGQQMLMQCHRHEEVCQSGVALVHHEIHVAVMLSFIQVRIYRDVRAQSLLRREMRPSLSICLAVTASTYSVHG